MLIKKEYHIFDNREVLVIIVFSFIIGTHGFVQYYHIIPYEHII